METSDSSSKLVIRNLHLVLQQMFAFVSCGLCLDFLGELIVFLFSLLFYNHWPNKHFSLRFLIQPKLPFCCWYFGFASAGITIGYFFYHTFTTAYIKQFTKISFQFKKCCRIPSTFLITQEFVSLIY